MTGYGIQNAVSNVVDNSVKIKKLVDLLPSEEDRALEAANNKAEAASLKAELAGQDATDAQEAAQKARVFSDSLKQYSAVKKGAVTRSVNKGETDPDVGKRMIEQEDELTEAVRRAAEGSAKDARILAQQAQQKANQAQGFKRAAIEAKIKALEASGRRKKSVFERLRGGSK